jgi:hypothetical protein
MGVHFVEASADNEADPLYSTAEVLEDWLAQVKRLPETHGLKVANFYSGHGTYATLGLAHPDARIRRHIMEDWIRPMVDLAGRAGAGLGFFTHAFSQEVLDEAEKYETARKQLVESLSEVCAYADRQGLPSVGVEQMYTPHQIPWRFEGARQLLSDVRALSGQSLYLTLDSGHASGQRRFLMPSREQIERFVLNTDAKSEEFLYVGSSSAQKLLDEMVRAGDLGSMEQLLEQMHNAPQFFCTDPMEGDFYAWLERLGCYSPIVHLQQTDGTSSSHQPFTASCNQRGIIEPGRVLEAIAESYRRPVDTAMPPRCEEIYLTLEIFASTAGYPHQLLAQLEQSVEYWRRSIPEDGLSLDTLCQRPDGDPAQQKSPRQTGQARKDRA